MRRALLAVILVTAAMLLTASVCAAEIITISYGLLNTVETDTATIFTLELEVTNTGAADLNNVVLVPASPLVGGVSGTAGITTVAPGETKKATGSFTSPKGFLNIEPLFFNTTYTDGSGQLQTTMIQGIKG